MTRIPYRSLYAVASRCFKRNMEREVRWLLFRKYLKRKSKKSIIYIYMCVCVYFLYSPSSYKEPKAFMEKLSFCRDYIFAIVLQFAVV